MKGINVEFLFGMLVLSAINVFERVDGEDVSGNTMIVEFDAEKYQNAFMYA